MKPKLHEIEEVKVIHADGSEGVAKLRVIGIVKEPLGKPNPESQPAGKPNSESGSTV